MSKSIMNPSRKIEGGDAAKRDASGHYDGCRHFSGEAPTADPDSAYIDAFCDDCHDFHLPVVGFNGTDVDWPSGWTEEEAEFWRNWRGILRPGDSSPEVCPRCNGEEWVCENHPREPYTMNHHDGEGMPCPVCSAWAYPSDKDGDQRPQPTGPTWLSGCGAREAR
jgi:hypothetical protein